MKSIEQDKELREKISHRFDSVCAEGHQQSCGEYQTAVDDVMQLITAEADRRVYRFADSIYGDVTGAYLLNENLHTSALLKDTETILNAELKAQQEEVK